MMDAAEAERARAGQPRGARRQTDGRSAGRRPRDRQPAAPGRLAAKGKPSTAPLKPLLSEGLLAERRLFHAPVATADQKEGMAAFIAKRPAQFTGQFAASSQ